MRFSGADEETQIIRRRPDLSDPRQKIKRKADQERKKENCDGQLNDGIIAARGAVTG
jgi:hypothetical protein